MVLGYIWTGALATEKTEKRAKPNLRSPSSTIIVKITNEQGLNEYMAKKMENRWPGPGQKTKT